MEQISVYRAGKISAKSYAEFKLYRMGNDLIIEIGGGVSHIGSLAMIAGNDSVGVRQITLEGHREDVIVRKTIDSISDLVPGSVLVIGGIHYDDITRDQIGEINQNCDLILCKIRKDLENKTN